MIELLWNQCIVTLMIRLFAYAPFMEHLRYGLKKTLAIILSTEVLWIGFFYLLVTNHVSISFTQLFSIPLFGILYFLTVKIDWGKILFLYAFTTAYVMAVRGLAFYLELLLFQSAEPGFYSWRSSLFLLAVYFLSLPFMLWYIKRTAQIVIDTDVPALWQKVWVLPMFNTLTVLLFTYYPESAGLVNTRFILTRILLLVCMFFIYYFVLYSIKQLQQKIATEEHVSYLQQLVSFQASQYTFQKNYIEDTRRARHDLRQHLKVIQAYIDKGDSEALASYVKLYGASIPKEIHHNYSHNYAVDLLLGFYAEKASEAGIHMDISFCSMPETIIPEPEFCVLLGNLLENALEACGGKSTYMHRNSTYMPTHQSSASPQTPLITLRASHSGSHTFILTVDNTCPCPPTKEGERMRSTKHEGLGIGTDSVRNIAEKYQGDARFSWKDGIFYASVMLNI